MTTSIARNDQALEILSRAFMHRFHSLAEYMLAAGAYVRAEDRPLVEQIRSIAAFDREEAERLADVIESLDGIPQAPPYFHGIAEFNYLSIRFLKDKLAESLSTELAQYERALPLLHSHAAARNALYRLCGKLRSQIAMLSQSTG